MRHKIKIFLALLILAGFVLACNLRNSDNNNAGRVSTKSDENITTGGNCFYKDYKGIAKIKDVQPISGSSSSTGNSQEKFKVNYVFETSVPDAPDQVKQVDRELWLTKQEIERNQIKAGKQFPATASYQEGGTCPPGPFLYEFEKSLSAGNR